MALDYEKYRSALKDKEEALNKLSDDIWDYAETTFAEVKSVEALTGFLASEGFEVHSPAFTVPTAFYATYGSGHPIIGILGEYDALSGLSQKAGLTEKVEDPALPQGNGHGCGHNLLGAGSVGAALMVKAYLDDGHPGTIVYYGCPAEEGGSGKSYMASRGAFADLDCAITWHPGTANIIVKDTYLANVQIKFNFHGISSHAAGCPERGRSALDALELMNIGVQFLREHMQDAAKIHYAIVDAGGISPNVVQNHASALYLIRSPKVGEVQELYQRTLKIAQGAALMTETTMDYSFVSSAANPIVNRTLEKELYKAFGEEPAPVYTEEEYAISRAYTATVDGDKNLELTGIQEAYFDPSYAETLRGMRDHGINDFVVPYEELHIVKVLGGSTDVGDCSWMTPTAQIQTACWAPSTPGHSWQVVSQGKSSMAHKGMNYAARVMGRTIIDLMENPDKIAEARKEWETTLTGQSYVRVPDDAVAKPPVD